MTSCARWVTIKQNSLSDHVSCHIRKNGASILTVSSDPTSKNNRQNSGDSVQIHIEHEGVVGNCCPIDDLLDYNFVDITFSGVLRAKCGAMKD